MGNKQSKEANPSYKPDKSNQEVKKDSDKWNDKQTFKCYEMCTTALIKYQVSIVETKQKEVAYSDAWSDMEQDYVFHKIKMFITPQIGYNAGIEYEFICSKPMVIDCISHSDISSVSDSWSDNLVYFPESPTPKNTAERILLCIHGYWFKNKLNSLTPRFTKQYIQIPFILNPYRMIYLTENMLDLNICRLVMKYSGVCSLKINFIPNHIFKSFTIHILYGMTFHEINALIQTHLFMKYPQLTHAPPFHYYDNKGIKKIHSFKQIFDQKELLFCQNELCVLFSTKHMSKIPSMPYPKSYIILNFVGFGFKMIENIDPNKVIINDLINMFHETTKCNVKNEGVTFMFGFDLSGLKIKAKSCQHEIFEAKKMLRQGYSTTFDPKTLWPITKTKKCVHVNYNKYETYKHLSLKEINFNVDAEECGMLINMYNATGPCICINYHWIKADVIFFPSYLYIDVNLEWTMDVYCNYMNDKIGYTFSMKYMKEKQMLGDSIKGNEKNARIKANEGKPPQCANLIHY